MIDWLRFLPTSVACVSTEQTGLGSRAETVIVLLCRWTDFESTGGQSESNRPTLEVALELSDAWVDSNWSPDVVVVVVVGLNGRERFGVGRGMEEDGARDKKVPC